MDNLTEIVNEICPPGAHGAFSIRAHRAKAASVQDWAELVDINESASSLPLSAGVWANLSNSQHR